MDIQSIVALLCKHHAKMTPQQSLGGHVRSYWYLDGFSPCEHSLLCWLWK